MGDDDDDRRLYREKLTFNQDAQVEEVGIAIRNPNGEQANRWGLEPLHRKPNCKWRLRKQETVGCEYRGIVFSYCEKKIIANKQRAN
uniref:Uncharacterized protein n=1 Tax=Angiostrongylus cantonensis TaxID=6313 RepID=A0A158P8H4_ANGCA